MDVLILKTHPRLSLFLTHSHLRLALYLQAISL